MSQLFPTIDDASDPTDYATRLSKLKAQHQAPGQDGDILFCYADGRYGQSYRWIKVLEYRLVENTHEPQKPFLYIRFQKRVNESALDVAPEWEERVTDKSYTEFMYGNGRWMVWNVGYNASQMMEQAVGLLDGKGLDDLQKQLALEASAEKADQQGLVLRNSAEHLNQMLEHTRERTNQLQVINQFMQMEMLRRQAALQAIHSQANNLLATLTRKVERIIRMITTIELYMGIEEELHQIQSGEPAPSDTPISFRQKALYMDEEIAVRIGYQNALDFDLSTIEKFDEWLLEPGNLDYIMAEPRGIIALKIRRTAKDYSGDPFINALLNKENLNNTYFLIRNGQNVYRIFTHKLALETRLFPYRDELASLVEQMQKVRSETEKDNMEIQTFVYRKLVTFLQGLLDRTTVFGQTKEPINLFHLNERTQELIRFIYDDEHILSDGRPRFTDWLKQTNSVIEEGSRIVMTGIYEPGRYQWARNFQDRLFYYCHESNVPPLPQAGRYQVEKAPPGHIWDRFAVNKRPKNYCVRYNPKNTVYGSWDDYNPHERKNRIAWAIDPEKDLFFLNYDAIRVEDIDYYLQSRLHRPEYLHMLPVLQQVLIEKQEEARQEAPFIQMVVDEARRQHIPADTETVEAAIVWWKTKNKWKRAITVDDAKALRMILTRLRSLHTTHDRNGVEMP